MPLCRRQHFSPHDLRDWLWRILKTLTPDLHVHREKPLLQDEDLSRNCQRKYDLDIADLSVSPRPQAYDLTFISPHSEPYARDGSRHPSWAATTRKRQRNDATDCRLQKKRSTSIHWKWICMVASGPHLNAAYIPSFP